MKNAIQKFKQSRFAAFFVGCLSFVLLSLTAFADPMTYQDVTQEISNVLDSDALIGVLKYAAGVAVVLVLLWWSIRKVISIIKRAFMRGKLRL